MKAHFEFKEMWWSFLIVGILMSVIVSSNVKMIPQAFAGIGMLMLLMSNFQLKRLYKRHRSFLNNSTTIYNDGDVRRYLLHENMNYKDVQKILYLIMYEARGLVVEIYCFQISHLPLDVKEQKDKERLSMEPFNGYMSLYAFFRLLDDLKSVDALCGDPVFNYVAVEVKTQSHFPKQIALLKAWAWLGQKWDRVVECCDCTFRGKDLQEANKHENFIFEQELHQHKPGCSCGQIGDAPKDVMSPVDLVSK